MVINAPSQERVGERLSELLLSTRTGRLPGSALTRALPSSGMVNAIASRGAENVIGQVARGLVDLVEQHNRADRIAGVVEPFGEDVFDLFLRGCPHDRPPQGVEPQVAQGELLRALGGRAIARRGAHPSRLELRDVELRQGVVGVEQVRRSARRLHLVDLQREA